MRNWRWPQWAMIAWWALWVGLSFYNTVDGGRILAGLPYIVAWFGFQIFLMWKGGFWK